MQMEIPFTHQGHQGRVIVTLETTREPAILGVWDGALGLANCKAAIEFSAGGYLGLLDGFNLCAPPTILFMGASSKWILLILSGFTNALRCRTAGMASRRRSSTRHHGKNGFNLIGSLTVSLPLHLLAATREL